MRKFNIIVITIFVLMFTQALPVEKERTTEEIEKKDELNYRLPGNVVPKHYNIKLIVCFQNFVFDGESNIDLNVINATSTVALHTSEDLTINETATYLEDRDGRYYCPLKFDYDNDTEILSIGFDSPLESGHYNLHIKFEGILNDGTSGFYRSSYINEFNDTIWLATTQFEATAARKAFPCWDEPALKATFNISIKHKANYKALSNMPVLSRSEIDETDGKIWTNFEMTPIMSTYLVAFVICDYERISNSDETINIWSKKSDIPYTTLIQEIAQSAAMELRRYTNSSMRVPKMDHISIPDFASGAMENWGLITYAEKSLLYDEVNDSPKQRDWVTMVVIHELTHQWFGNIVSPSWWSHVWLNEGFAAYFQHYIIDKIFKDCRYMDLFVVSNKHTIMNMDVYDFIEPIDFKVTSPKEIKGIFSYITYGKASSILRMLSAVLSEEVFRLGLIRYLNKHAYSIASPDDLWESLQITVDESDVPHSDFKVKEFMDTWINQRGYPLVTVIRNYTNGEVKITQRMFTCMDYLLQEINDNSGCNKTIIEMKRSDGWWIPITYATQSSLKFSSTSPMRWLNPQDENIIINDVDINDWFIVNIQEIGHYRVKYDDENWMKIAKYLNSENYDKIHALNRAQIINDASELMHIGHLNPSIFLEILNYLSREKDYIPWYTTFQILDGLSIYLKTPVGNSLFKPYLLKLMSGIIDHVGFDIHPNDSHLMELTKLDVRYWACKFQHPECNAKATATLIAYLEDSQNDKVPTYLTTWVYCHGMHNANESIWDKVFDLYIQNEDFPTIYYLSCTQNATIVEKYLNMTIVEDAPFNIDCCDEIYRYLASRGYSEIVLDFLMDNFEYLQNYSNETEILSQIMIDITENTSQLDKLKSFFEDKEQDVSSDISVKEASITMLNKKMFPFLKWLENNNAN